LVTIHSQEINAVGEDGSCAAKAIIFGTLVALSDVYARHNASRFVPAAFEYALSAASTVRINWVICSDADATGADGAAGELLAGSIACAADTRVPANNVPSSTLKKVFAFGFTLSLLPNNQQQSGLRAKPQQKTKKLRFFISSI
jgi:hypothetical protein